MSLYNGLCMLHLTLKIQTFHFHVEFYPPLRSGDKPKILAGTESMAGVFVMDVLTRRIGRKF